MQYFTKITGIRETEQGTDLIVTIPGEQLGRKISKYKMKGVDWIDAELKLNDGRTITIDQRKKIYATIRDISTFTGDEPEYLKEILKYDYCAATGEEPFSLSNCSINTAREFINHLIDFILKWNIPLTSLGIERTDDVDRYLYGCIKFRRCAICGQSNVVHLHHIDAVGMGRDRTKISHIGMEMIALCAKHHKEAHDKGDKAFKEKYCLYGIKVTPEIEKIIKRNKMTAE